MGLKNPAHIHALKKMINQGGYFELLSMTVEKMELGLAELHVELSKNHLNPFGGIHGGVYSSVLGSAAYCDMPDETGFITINMKVDILKAAELGEYSIIGKRIKASPY